MQPFPPELFEQQARARRQQDRFMILCEEYGDQGDTLVDQWIEAQVGGAAADALGPPDLSANTLLAAATQLSTPGLYGLGEPRLSHTAPNASELVRWLSTSGYWARMQFVQRMVVGLGDWVLALSVENGQLYLENAYPWRLWTRSSPHSPTDVREVRWLRMRHTDPSDPTSPCEWFWDCYNLDTPSFRVLDRDNVDYSNVHIRVEGGYAPVGGLTGDAYPYRRSDGTPFLPFVFYSDANDGQLWHDNTRRGATRGALNTITLSTYQLRALMSASMPPTVAVNLEQPPAQAINVGDANNAGSTTAASLPSIPGTILFTRTTSPEVQGAIHQLSVGGNLQALNQGVANYFSSQFARLGMSSDDVQRDSANPTSAAALSISRSAKRERAQMVAPFFRIRDAQVIEYAAYLASAAGLGNWPATGWSIEYTSIPLSPDEAEAERADMTWSREQGLISKIDMYRQRHPGATREDAIAALKRVQADEAELEKATEEPEEGEPEEGMDDAAIVDLATEVDDLLRSGNIEEARLALREVLTLLKADVAEDKAEDAGESEGMADA